MNKLRLGIILGIFAGIVDVIPMIAQGLTWDANLSAFLMWCVTGFLIGTSNLKLKPVFKGMIIAFLVFITSAPLIGVNNPMTLLLPILPTTLVLGALLAWLIDKYGK